MMAGLSIVIVKLKLWSVQALVRGNMMAYLLSTNSKKPLIKNKFLPGLQNGGTMSPMIGNGGANKCLIFSVT